MSQFLKRLIRSTEKSCNHKIKYGHEESAITATKKMMIKKPDEVFEHYKCDYCEGFHIGHRTNFDWIPTDHSPYSILTIKYFCKNCDLNFYTNTVFSNRIIEHFPDSLSLSEKFVRCVKCKNENTSEIERRKLSLKDVHPDAIMDSLEIWERSTKIDTNLSLQNQNEKLRLSIRNKCGDDLCWLEDPELGKGLPREEFMESCSRYQKQISETLGIIPMKSMTIAQLEARILELEELLNIPTKNNIISNEDNILCKIVDYYPRYDNVPSEFVNNILLPKLEQAIMKNKVLIIYLDGPYYSSYFLRGMINRLIEVCGHKNIYKKYIRFEAFEEPYLIQDIFRYVEEYS